MKFKKFGKALLMSALSAGVILSVTSCVQSYSVGYLYVTGTVTATTTGNGILSGYKIDHNTGKLTTIAGLPVSSGGSNPIRAVLISGSKFIYVLNRGTNASGGSDCTTADPCKNANITVFAVGGNGILTAQETFYTQGLNPFRMIADSSGAHLLVLDHDTAAPDSTASNPIASSASDPNPNCALALGTGVTSCGDVTVFSINGTTGRLSLVTNAQVNSSTGSALTYFPVPANPVDFVLSSSYVFTLSASASAIQTYPYTGGTKVFPYSYSSSTGQLTVSSNGIQTLTDGSTTAATVDDVSIDSGYPSGNAITASGSYVYVLDNKPIKVSGITYPSQILPFTVATGGALNSTTSGAVAGDATLSNPVALLVENKSKWIYVANAGPYTTATNTESGISAYVMTTSPYNLATMAGEPFGAGAGPQCIVEDPSYQFIYTANYNDSTITGRVINQNSGNLVNLNTTSTYSLTGPPTWCLVDGRTD
jgi:6-phosphogluconolactonase